MELNRERRVERLKTQIEWLEKAFPYLNRDHHRNWGKVTLMISRMYHFREILRLLKESKMIMETLEVPLNVPWTEEWERESLRDKWRSENN